MTLETDKSVYQLGEEANILYRLENDSQCTVSIYSNWYPGWDVYVYPNPDNLPLPEFYYTQDPAWNAVQSVAWMIWTWYMQPGEVFEQPVVWDLTDYEGDPVTPGGYEVLGTTAGAVSYPSGVEIDWTNFHSHITVVPEPSMVILLCAGLPLLRKKIPPAGR